MSLAWNHLNLPKTFTFAGNKVIAIVYDASGRKLRKTVTDNGTQQYLQDYAAGIEYRTTPTKAQTLESIYHSEGRVFNTNLSAASTAEVLRYEYVIKDHLGNARLTFTDKNANGQIDMSNVGTVNEVIQESHYYPFGLDMPGVWINDSGVLDNQYKYNGKELNGDFGLNLMDYGARWYDASVGRWWAVDPLAEKYKRWSPYNYGMDNPVRFIDPDGMSVKGDIYNLNGTHVGNDGRNDNKVFIKLNNDDHQLSQAEAKSEIDDLCSNSQMCTGFKDLVNVTDVPGGVNHHEFQQIGAFAFNETYQTDIESNRNAKFAVASTIINDAEARSIPIQTSLDHTRFKGDSHAERMSAGSASPPSDKMVPGTNISYSNVKTGSYQSFYNASSSQRNANIAMKTSMAAAVNAVLNGKDYSNGATNWGGIVPSYGTKTATVGGNVFYKLKNSELYKYGN
jgi:RHS repeat-associated protein